MALNRPVVTADALPPELLGHVFAYLDQPPPSDGRLHEQPRMRMLHEPQCPLKIISLVSKRWRAIVLPTLFRHVLWSLEPTGLLAARPRDDEKAVDQLPMLAFLQANDLGRHVLTFTMIVVHAQSFDTTSPATSSSSHHDLDSGGPAADPVPFHLANPSFSIYNENHSWLWNALLGLVDPLRFTIMASPQTLARLFAAALFIGDADLFASGEQLHIFSLSRESRSAAAQQPPSTSFHNPATITSPGTAAPSPEHTYSPPALFTLRPWTHLLLNENSSIRAYRHYEFFAKNPPSLLHPLLCRDEVRQLAPLIPPTVTSLAYVAIFPLSAHFRKLVRNLPRVDRLFVQLLPRNDILLDADEMSHVHASDLWLERQNCLSLVRGQLEGLGGGAGGDGADGEDDSAADQNWRLVQRLETGDAHDKEWWEWLVRYIGTDHYGWRVEGEGVLVRARPAPEAASDGESTDSDATAP